MVGINRIWVGYTVVGDYIAIPFGRVVKKVVTGPNDPWIEGKFCHPRSGLVFLAIVGKSVSQQRFRTSAHKRYPSTGWLDVQCQQRAGSPHATRGCVRGRKFNPTSACTRNKLCIRTSRCAARRARGRPTCAGGATARRLRPTGMSACYIVEVYTKIGN